METPSKRWWVPLTNMGNFTSGCLVFGQLPGKNIGKYHFVRQLWVVLGIKLMEFFPSFHGWNFQLEAFFFQAIIFLNAIFIGVAFLGFKINRKFGKDTGNGMEAGSVGLRFRAWKNVQNLYWGGIMGMFESGGLCFFWEGGCGFWESTIFFWGKTKKSAKICMCS